jgi:hypothetical protein
MARNVCRLLAIAMMSLVPGAGQVRATSGPQAEPIRTIRLQVDPAPEPRFALQYLFETPYVEQEPGNAAFLYQTAVGQMMQVNSGDNAIDGDTLRQWYDDPTEDLPLETVRPAIARFEQSFRLLEAAARRERCTWEYPIRAGGVPYVNPLLSEYRTLSRLVAVKARLEIHAGDLDAAFNTLRSGVILARDVGSGPNLIQHLVGITMAAGTLHQIDALIQKPEAPNLYWALTALPDPLVDIRKAVQMESEALHVELPELLTLEDNVLSNERVLGLWKRAGLWVGNEDNRPGRWLDKARDLAIAMERYPQAKTRLLEQGYLAEKVQNWPALYVILLDQYHQFRAVRDMSFKWTYVPYAEARDGLRQAEEEVSRIYQYSGGSDIANPFLYSLPATQRICFLDARLARDIAILRCVEALRMYAADHDGKLPKSLDEVTAVPVPLDPLHGRAFHYELTGGKAIVESAIPPEGGPKGGLRYEITLR